MELKILGIKEDAGAICYLCETSLYSYVTSLGSKYKKYDVQRGIVKNIYLDKISDTVFSKGHIPPMVLVTKKFPSLSKVGGKVKLDDFNILDGLQRSFRIKRIWDSINFYYQNLNSQKVTRSNLIKSHEADLKKIDIDPTEVLRLVDKIDNMLIKEKEFINLYKENILWVEVWTNLNKKQQIGKMLTLNAGHKPMQKRHQLELLFLNLEQILQDEGQGTHDDFCIIRERDLTVTTFQKNKEAYHYHLSILIAAVISYVQGKVIIPGVSLVKDIHDEGIDIVMGEDDFNLEDIFDSNFYEPFIKAIIVIDDVAKNDELVLKWSARETILPGLMAALGRYRIENGLDIEKPLELFCKTIKKNGCNFFNVADFEKARSKIPVQKVNVGKYLRDLVYYGLLDALQNSRSEIRWTNVKHK